MTIEWWRRSSGWEKLFAVIAALAWVGLLLYKIEYLRHGGHQIDDSYMFYRYALNLRHGLGFSWNLDGVHTFGMTTLLWPWVIVVFSFLPVQAALGLTLASWLCSGLAIWVVSAAVWRNAQSGALKNPVLVATLVTFSLLLAPAYDFASASGMESMLGFTLMAGVMALVLEDNRVGVAPWWTGLAVVLLYLTRPEGVLPALLFVGLSPFLLPKVRVRRAAVACAIGIAGIVVVLVCNKMYFGTAVPLSFYIKSHNPYRGYDFRSYSFSAGLTFVKESALWLLVVFFLVGRRTWKVVALAAIPMLAILAYLCTVVQIMGFHERYYLPYIPLLVVPAMLVLDDHLNTGDRAPRWGNLALVAVYVAFLAGYFPRSVQFRIEGWLEKTPHAFLDVVYEPPTKPAPPIDYFVSMRVIVKDIAGPLPRGTTIAATEVGYIGAGLPNLNVIDMAGLNDQSIALHGFDVDKFLARKPDMIWMPHFNYTWQRGELMTNPQFLAQYDFYAGAFLYGFAVRKDSPVHDQVTRELEQVWPTIYPGTKADDALAGTITWPVGDWVTPVAPGEY